MASKETAQNRPDMSNIGQRVTLRIHDPAGGFRDLVGVLESESSLRKRDGSLVHFASSEIAVWRIIKPPLDRAGRGAPLSLRIQDMELAANATWPAKEEFRLGDWILRATGKFTMRANSVLALGSPGVNLQEAIATVVTFYRDRDLTPSIHIALPTYAELNQTLEDQGWTVAVTARVMVADIADLLAEREKTERPLKEWEINSSPSDEWIALQGDQGVLEIMKSAPARYAGLRINGELIAVGRAATQDKWTVLTRLFVLPEYRGSGHGRELVRALIDDAMTLGATKTMLQVNATNTGAISLYHNMGFRQHHTYLYRSLQASQSETKC